MMDYARKKKINYWTRKRDGFHDGKKKKKVELISVFFPLVFFQIEHCGKENVVLCRERRLWRRRSTQPL